MHRQAFDVEEEDAAKRSMNIFQLAFASYFQPHDTHTHTDTHTDVALHSPFGCRLDHLCGGASPKGLHPREPATVAVVDVAQALQCGMFKYHVRMGESDPNSTSYSRLLPHPFPLPLPPSVTAFGPGMWSDLGGAQDASSTLQVASLIIIHQESQTKGTISKESLHTHTHSHTPTLTHPHTHTPTHTHTHAHQATQPQPSEGWLRFAHRAAFSFQLFLLPWLLASGLVHTFTQGTHTHTHTHTHTKHKTQSRRLDRCVDR